MNSNEEETRMKRSFTWDEVRQHKDRGNRWLVIDNDVYDITQWQHKHPGGAKILGHYAGEDASVRFFRLERIFIFVNFNILNDCIFLHFHYSIAH